MLKPIDSFNLVRGMSQELPSHLPADRPSWWFTKNARFRRGRIVQKPIHAGAMSINTGGSEVTVISAYPQVDRSVQFLLAGNGLYLIDFGNPPFGFLFFVQPMGFVADVSFDHRWACVTTEAGVYYVNLLNPIIYFDGVTCTSSTLAGPTYKAKYMVNFYQHLVVANLIDGSDHFPLRVAYSQVNDFTDFDPLTTNEADYYDIPNNEQNSVFNLGITGLCQVGDVLAVLTVGSIWNMRYIGFDNGVMSFTRQIDTIGCWLPHSAISADRYCIFIGNGDIYVYDGVTCRSIGGPIVEFFFDSLSQDPDIRARTWGTIDVVNNEIRWYYPTRASSGPCDGAIVFNWQTKDWYSETGSRKTAEAVYGGSSFRSIDSLDNLSATINGLDTVADTIDGLDSFFIFAKGLFASEEAEFGPGVLLYEITSTSVNVLGANIYDNQYELESRDFIIGTPEEVAELDTILIDAECFPGQPTTQDLYGWDVYVSARNYTHEATNYVYYGRFSGVEPELRYTKTRVSGRIFRFKFVSVYLINSRFFGFTPNFHAGTTER